MPLDETKYTNIDVKLIITISLRYDNHFCVTLKKTDKMTEKDTEHLLDLCEWFNMMDVWSQGDRYFSEKYELPNSLDRFLYSDDFEHTVYKKFNSKEVIIVRYF